MTMGTAAADRGGKHPERTGGGREPSLVTQTTGHKEPNWPEPPKGLAEPGRSSTLSIKSTRL